MDATRLRQNLIAAASLADERISALHLRIAASTDDDETAGLALRAAFQSGLSVGLQQAADALGEVTRARAEDLDDRAARAVELDGGDVPRHPLLPANVAAALDPVHVEHERVRLGVERRRLVEVVDGLAGLVYAAHLAAAAIGVRLEPLVDELADAHVASLAGAGEPIVDLVEHLVSQGWTPTS